MRWPYYWRQVRAGWFFVDDADSGLVEPFLWRQHAAGYVYRAKPGGGMILLHRDLCGLTPGDGLEVDHINGDRLDNRRANLRVVTRSENAQNLAAKGTSPHRGVFPRRGKWYAQVRANGRRHYLGTFDTELEAAAVVSAFRSEHMPFTNEQREPAATGA